MLKKINKVDNCSPTHLFHFRIIGSWSLSQQLRAGLRVGITLGQDITPLQGAFTLPLSLTLGQCIHQLTYRAHLWDVGEKQSTWRTPH